MPEIDAYWLTLAVFALTYLGLALGRLPGLRTDRPGIALIGAAAMLGFGLISFDAAVAAVDFKTIMLLLGMMIVVGYLRRAAFFERLAGWVLGRVTTPRGLLAATMALSGVLSALLVNDVVCLALTPLVLHLARRLGLDPRPHLIGLAVASNLGSAATLTGNPQNMIIGGLSGIPYGRFAAKLAPPALMGLVVGYFITAWVFRAVLDRVGEPLADGSKRTRGRPVMLAKGLAVTAGAIVLFFAGAPMPVVALGAAAFLLLDRVNPERIYRGVDWGLLVMFAGLFVAVKALEVHVVSTWHVERWRLLHDSPVGVLSLLSAGLSNLVSNVPAVMLFEPVVPTLPAEARETAWLALAASSTFAGNLTVLGSVANLIVVEQARREGVAVTLGDYCRVGVPVTLVTLGIGAGWLWAARY